MFGNAIFTYLILILLLASCLFIVITSVMNEYNVSPFSPKVMNSTDGTSHTKYEVGIYHGIIGSLACFLTIITIINTYSLCKENKKRDIEPNEMLEE